VNNLGKTILTGACIGALLAVAVAPAEAKAPPAGKYECVIGSTLFGNLQIKSGGSYRHRGTSGTFKAGSKRVSFKDGRKGYRISFKKGSLNGFKGRWYRSPTDGTYEIALLNPVDNFESIYCDKWK